MNTMEKHGKLAPRMGLFLFFLLGLFMLQIGFAFTIHGDIGSHGVIASGLERPASPALVGKIDSLISSTGTHGIIHPTPVSAPAPAMKPTSSIEKAALPISTNGSVIAATSLKTRKDLKHNKRVPRQVLISSVSAAHLGENGGRYLEYTINRGDTLDTIARHLYGNARMVTALIRLNRLTNERNLRCGEKLRVPRNGLMASVSR
ncbi:MAG: LysM peptidoglycan-binding domain-containing protein [Candidatus Riflebacteria bacterium]|nr:LysM peptidoglycan-binding domain-containing protein [Candidatus Riflebacteria bacterium]